MLWRRKTVVWNLEQNYKNKISMAHDVLLTEPTVLWCTSKTLCEVILHHDIFQSMNISTLFRWIMNFDNLILLRTQIPTAGLTCSYIIHSATCFHSDIQSVGLYWLSSYFCIYETSPNKHKLIKRHKGLWFFCNFIDVFSSRIFFLFF